MYLKRTCPKCGSNDVTCCDLVNNRCGGCGATFAFAQTVVTTVNDDDGAGDIIAENWLTRQALSNGSLDVTDMTQARNKLPVCGQPVVVPPGTLLNNMEGTMPNHGFSPDSIKHMGPQIFPEDRRLRMVHLSVEEFARLFLGSKISSDGNTMRVVMLSGLPKDVKFVEFRFEWMTHTVDLVVWSFQWKPLVPYEMMSRVEGISLVEKVLRFEKLAGSGRYWFEPCSGQREENTPADLSPTADEEVGEPLMGYAKHKWEKYLE